MKKFFQKILVLFAVIIATLTTINTLSPTPAYADSDSDFGCREFLGLTSWDCGLKNFESKADIEESVVIIAANVFVDLTIIAAYLVLGYVIYGGYQYIFSSGDASKVASGKKTLTHALIGLAIVMLASVILGAIRAALLGENKLLPQNCINSECITPTQLVTHLISWVIGIAGVVAVVFAVMSGIGYMTSAGDAAKLKKSRDTLISALIGLAIVGFAQAITAFVSNAIENAKTSYINQTLIAKEHHEE